MIKKVLEVAIAALGWVLLFSTSFSIAIYFSLDNYEMALELGLTLFIGLLTVFSTVGAVWVAIYTLTDKIPKLHLQCVSYESHYDSSFLMKNVHTIKIRIDNFGGEAINFKSLLIHQGAIHNNKYSISPEYGFEIIDSRDVSNLSYLQEITIHGHPDVTALELVNHLDFKLAVNYRDRFSNTYNEIHAIKTNEYLINLEKQSA